MKQLFHVILDFLFALQPVVYYLVKWCSLPYEDATWELKEDVDEGKVEEFSKIANRQPRLKRTVSGQANGCQEELLSPIFNKDNRLFTFLCQT